MTEAKLPLPFENIDDYNSDAGDNNDDDNSEPDVVPPRWMQAPIHSPPRPKPVVHGLADPTRQARNPRPKSVLNRDSDENSQSTDDEVTTIAAGYWFSFDIVI